MRFASSGREIASLLLSGKKHTQLENTNGSQQSHHTRPQGKVFNIAPLGFWMIRPDNKVETFVGKDVEIEQHAKILLPKEREVRSERHRVPAALFY